MNLLPCHARRVTFVSLSSTFPSSLFRAPCAVVRSDWLSHNNNNTTFLSSPVQLQPRSARLSSTPSTSFNHHKRLTTSASTAVPMNHKATANSDVDSSSTGLPSPIVVIGASGKMGGSIINGIVSDTSTSTTSSPRIIGTGTTKSRMAHLPIDEGDKLDDNIAAMKQAAVIVVSVKPNVAPKVFEQIATVLSESPSHQPVIVSVVAGITLQQMRTMLKDDAVPIVRTMPNTPVSVNAGCTAICSDAQTAAAAVDKAAAILECIGDVERVDEKVLDAATGIAGCGVAYLFMAAEAMADAGVKHGLKRETALRMAASTVFGAGKLLKEGGKHPAILRNEVESPGGVTVQATSKLEEEGFRAAIGAAIDSVVQKLYELENKK